MTDTPVDQIQTTFRLYKICVTIYNFQYKLQQIWDFHFHTCRNLNDGSSGFFFFFTWVFKKKDVLNLLSAHSLTPIYRWMHDNWNIFLHFVVLHQFIILVLYSTVGWCIISRCSIVVVTSPSPPPPLLNHFPKFFLPFSTLSIN